MTTLPERLRIPTTPQADDAAIIAGERYRITVLTESLVRLEWSDSGEFEDRATQTVLNRAFPVPEFAVTRGPAGLVVTTASLQLHYDEGPFTPGGLWAKIINKSQNYGAVWRCDEAVKDHHLFKLMNNLGGTARTLDEVDGAVPLEPGLVSPAGYGVLDDSGSAALTDDGWVAPRLEGHRDLYLFGHGRDYRAALRDFYALTGPQPLLPRFALGNWWSRYHPYSDAEYRELITRFERDRLPFSVAVIDMDWHLVDVPPEYGSGWTGYTWNRELFPDPEGFLGWLHEHGLKTSLNVHPADGIRAFEDCYPRMARAMGVDPATKQPIDFDIADPEFLVPYLEEVHHPLEDEGVDFWWLDWQQGTYSQIPGLDPLWLLNHFHFLDSARRGGRPLTFSRYAGPGSHRYPVGFSGDTVISWASLDFQPYFTATASNVGYGWWSHDIGGHFFGSKDDELATRWVQLGCFAPINRLHSTRNVFNGKEPWRYNAIAEGVMGRYLRLRARLLPYLYTMAERAHADGRPIVEPLYYECPGEEAAYAARNSYLFGSELLVAPITTPAADGTRLGRVRTYLPVGTWIDFLTGWVYAGGRTLDLHRDLGGYPVLARAGAIVPLQAPDAGTGNPAALELRVFAGADGSFTLYEDDDAAEPRAARTAISWDWASGTLTVDAPEGDVDVLPEERAWTVAFVGVADSEVVGHEHRYDAATATLTVELGAGPVDEGVTVRLRDPRLARNDVRGRVFALLDRAEIGFSLKEAAWFAVRDAPDAAAAVAGLGTLDAPADLVSALHELVLAQPWEGSAG